MMISMPDNIKAYFSDYKLNLVQILDSDKYTFYNEDVRDVFNIIRNIYRFLLIIIGFQYTFYLNLRLAVICGIVKNAKLFILDEPTAYLDEENSSLS